MIPIIFHQMLTAFITSEILRFVRTTCDSNAFITLANQLLKKNEQTGQ